MISVSMQVQIIMVASLLAVSCSGGKSDAPSTTTVPTSPVTPAVASVRVTLPDSVLVPGQTFQATAAALDRAGTAISGKTFSWRTSDATLATVSSTGSVTAVKTGPVTISATADGIDGSAALRVLSEFTAYQLFKTIATGWDKYGFQDRYELADLNGDGSEDVLFGGWATYSNSCGANGSCADYPPNPKVPLSVLVQIGDGGWRNASTEMFGVGAKASWNRAQIADFNRDGKPDIFFPGFWDIPPVRQPSTWFIGAGSSLGVFYIDVGSNLFAHGSALYDINKDGCPDVITSNLVFFISDCHGGFTEQQFVPNGGCGGAMRESPPSKCH